MFVVCNESKEHEGIYSLIVTSKLHNNSSCKYGGFEVLIGLDASKDGVLDSDEVNRKYHFCSLATTEVEELSSLTRLADEPAGDNCSTGGHKVITGLDINRNAKLDAEETQQIKYVCNGDDAAVFYAVAYAEPEEPGEICTFGGQKVTSLLSPDHYNYHEDTEVFSTSFICNESEDNPVTVGANEYYDGIEHCEAV